MKNKKISSLILIFIIFTSFVSLVFATTDEYGNQINAVSVYQNEAGSWVSRDSRNSTTYSPLYNISIEYNQDLLVLGQGLLNATEFPDYANISSTYALGLQIFDDSTYQNPMTLQLPAYQTGGFWVMDFTSGTIDFDISSEVTVGNVTEWIDYQNGSGWLLVEQWTFQLVCDIPSTSESSGEGILNLGIFWFWLFVIFLFATPLFSVIALKGGGAKFFIYAILSFAFCITFYSMLNVFVMG